MPIFWSTTPETGPDPGVVEIEYSSQGAVLLHEMMGRAGAYERWARIDDVIGRMLYTPGQVASKYFNNDTTFEDGYITPDDSWDNYWRVGQNANLGWDYLGGGVGGTGAGAKSLGQELAGSRAFAQCQVTKVFRTVCLRDPVDGFDRDEIRDMTDDFGPVYGYDLKEIFAASAGYCVN